MAELIPVRQGEELDMRALAPFLAEVFSDGGPWEVQQYASGHSNLTYLLTSPARSVVLRRGPMGPVAPRAHDMVREHRFLEALHDQYPWAPAVYARSEDGHTLGAPFFVMEPRRGVLIDRAWLNGHPYRHEEGRRISDVMVNRLVDLHRVPWQRSALASMVKPEGFMRRQVEGWVARYQRAKTEEVPGVERLCRFLLERVPESRDATVVHYDYKLDNVLFDDRLDDLAGVFDWEMATVGDPLADLAVAMSYWTEAGDPAILKEALGEAPVTMEPGFYTRREWIEAYAARSGRAIHDFGYYLSFAYFKLAVILAQIYFRYLKGQTQDARFAHFGEATRQLLMVAMDVEL
ncbi:MAG: phosphotransferase family protein [Firmicutes bacterium]|nr:phosphotransferase family protein [Bacillota bacterium]